MPPRKSAQNWDLYSFMLWLSSYSASLEIVSSSVGMLCTLAPFFQPCMRCK